PDCRIDEPGWGLHVAWNDWIEVERLAADRERLAGCGRAFAEFLEHPLGRWLGDWTQELEARWLDR
ncbi:MAG TPA: alpha-L-fucosidase, partial [Pelomicrobium sp.]|nr:alpha-L-fucosidase [Pelomicrobium sp.]